MRGAFMVDMKKLVLVILFSTFALGADAPKDMTKIPADNYAALLKAQHAFDQDELNYVNLQEQIKQVNDQMQSRLSADQKKLEAARDAAYKAAGVDSKAFDADLDLGVFRPKKAVPAAKK